MYEAQFLLKRRPFAATPDSRCFLASGQIQSALDELVVCVEQGQGVAVVSAPAGTGKTLLCERLRAELETRFQVVSLPHASFLTRRALLQSILADLNHSYRRQDEQELRLELSPAIRALSPKREAMVLILDEAHMLAEDLLEELRILSDLADHGRPLVRLILVGQPGIEETLARPTLEALNQRIRAHVYLDSFDRATAVDYIDYRITWAGGRTGEIFTPDALDLIYRASDGVPRCINQLCDHSLLLAYVAEQKPVTAATIREALKDLRQLPLHWNESLLADQSDNPTDSTFDAIDDHQQIENSSELVQSFEFGADLPPTNSIVESDEPTDESASEEIGDQPHVDGVKVGDQQPEVRAFMATSLCKATLKNSLPPQASRRIETIAPGVVMEEIVSDRYAAIDGGFPLPTPINSQREMISAESTSSESKSDTPADQSVRFETVESALISDGIDESSSAEFEEVCSRLDGMLPEVNEDPGWDTSMLDAAFRMRRSNSVAEHDEWESLEEELGVSVCELANEVRSGLESEKSGTEVDLRQILAATQPVTIEVGAADRGPQTTSSTAESTERPYRNLFSRLRRKQQGLL
ncbi:MAG TPA: AAA family ATPase [Schlesneria sp.]|jgi:type II secretory pathway predicted ATPase ExeA